LQRSAHRATEIGWFSSPKKKHSSSPLGIACLLLDETHDGAGSSFFAPQQIARGLNVRMSALDRFIVPGKQHGCAAGIV